MTETPVETPVDAPVDAPVETPVEEVPEGTDATAEKTLDELDVHNGEPVRPTFTDAAGTERIAGPPVENWTPAPVDPTPEQIAAMDAHNEREATRQAEAAAVLTPPVAETEVPVEVTPTDPAAPVVEAPPADQPPTDQQYVDAAAVADADANVAAQVEAERAQAAEAQAQADDAALAAAEAQQVTHEEGQA